MRFLKLFFRRNLVNNKLTYLNIIGLTLGMFTFLFIFSYVFTEYSYDQHLAGSGEIYHLEQEVDQHGTKTRYSCTATPMGITLKNELACIESFATFGSIFETEILLVDESEFLSPSVLYANAGFFRTFQYKAVSGNLQHALEPGKMAITRSAAKKYFGTEQVVGESAKLLHDKKEPLTVTVAAVVEDIPYNSNVKFEMVCSIDDYLHLIGKWWGETWNAIPVQTYVKLKKGTDPELAKQQINTVAGKYMNNQDKDTWGTTTVHLEKISEKHFRKEYTMSHPTERFVGKSSLKALFLVGLITLVISWLNYINFLVFQNTKYFKEIGIRKISGSSTRRLVASMISESALLSAIPVCFSSALFFAVSPALYNLFHFQGMENSQINFGIFWGITLGLMFAGSILSSVVPVVKLTSFTPLEVLHQKAKHALHSGKSSPIVLTFQFVLSILLIGSILCINAQMKFLGKQKLGFTKENILVLSPPITPDAASYNQKMELFRKEALQIPGVEALSASGSIPGKKTGTVNFGIKNKPETINKYQGVTQDGDYFDVIDVRFVAGRNFSKLPELCRNQIIINETLLRKLGFSNPAEAIDQPTNYGDATIIGVVEDYHHTSLHDHVMPTLFRYDLNSLTYLMVKFRNSINEQQVATLKNKWEKVFNGNPFEYTFLEDQYSQQYNEDNQLSSVVLIFSLLSIFITVLGLIGTSLNNAYLKTKEIGIRKVNGAKVSEVMTMLNIDVVKWVAIAFVIATPVAYYAMNKWLENFAYKTSLSWWIFALSGLLVLGIALLTVSWQSWTAATRNPVEALRYE